jgi:rifampicin phosphotransferase
MGATALKRYTMCFEEIDKTCLPYVGGKGANLGEMTGAGFPVPNGFCVTTEAYCEFIESSQDMELFWKQLQDVNPDNLEDIRKVGKEIREHLSRVAMPDQMKAAILASWRSTGENYAYAVRSSATAEDLPTASFAGQQDTYLNIKGQDQLLQAIQDCWASLFTDRAILYRMKNNFDHRSVFLSVVVQRMVFPVVSGIMFTADPITGNRRVVSIDASFGLGEALVSGIVSADLYQVLNGKIVKKQVSQKKLAIYSLPEGGTVTNDLAADKQMEQALRDEQILQLAALGQQIEKHYGSEQDIEWCLEEGKYYIVQSRPITSLYPLPKIQDDHLHVLFSFGHQQMMTDAMKPLAISVLKTFLPFGKKGSVGAESESMVEAGGRLYIDLTPLLHLKPARKILPKMLSGIDERISNGIIELISRDEFLRGVKPNKRLLRQTIHFVRPIMLRVLRNITFNHTTHMIKDANAFMERMVEQSRNDVFAVSGSQRIKQIQENLGVLFSTLLQQVFPYPATGIVSLKLMEKCMNRWLGDTNELQLLNKSLAGNVTSEMGLQIGDLADIVRKFPRLIAYLQIATDETFYQGLAKVQGGAEFQQEFDQFMDKYGMRCPGEIDLTNPRWRETPTMLIPSLLSHIRSVAPGEHRQKYKQGEKEAKLAEKKILERLRKTTFGRSKAKWMSRLMKTYRNVMGIRELPKYIIVRHLDIYKQAILEEGKTLVSQGVLQEEKDVYHFSLDEIRSLLDGNFTGDVEELIQERTKRFEQYQKLTPPRVMTNEGEIVSGKQRNVQAPKGVLVGTPVSAGIVEGYARVVMKAEEAELNKGEILIAPFTDPGWTPLFHAAKGLVMEVGGMMTHGAVVAREYGIPSVVGIDKATEIIKTGQYIRVDGTRGFVEILKGPKA